MTGNEADVDGLIFLILWLCDTRIDIPMVQAENERGFHIQDRSARTSATCIARMTEIVLDVVYARKRMRADGTVRGERHLFWLAFGVLHDPQINMLRLGFVVAGDSGSQVQPAECCRGVPGDANEGVVELRIGCDQFDDSETRGTRGE